MKDRCLLYGSTGYTGQLIARLAAEQGLPLVLAGRNAEKTGSLAAALGLDHVVFGLEDIDEVQENIQDFGAVLHAAGPFIRTAPPMMEACLRAGVHYLDITGEIAVFEMAAALGPRASETGIMLMPGAGFDVVPTDCAALYLKNQLPDATHLSLGIASVGSRLSHGTATTMAENLGGPGAVRRNGKIVAVPVGHQTKTIPYSDELKRFAMTIPWGDVSTAYYSTGIPNIEVYSAVHPKTYRWIKLQRYFNWLLRSNLVRNYMKSRIKKQPAGPDDKQRERGRSYVWGQVSNAAGEERTVRLSMPEGYTLTAITSLNIVRKVLSGNAPAGFRTPAMAYGPDLILEVEGAKREELGR
ncbi:MAG: saccharopine dehydrogenase NADP-binding domain-containing protein [Phaeodactylibacter sp.]|nr:saccharopine dehydrogenase NADP-binding domain-containing protein [Phaeodactylibacter sp.]MCB9301063.1 saccharopine dehydrogenase NADP-binding domain-containing protein [Lewinellaceae bacterium]HQU60773.1 saccharopine dehydrogenase NADP-binding domain-containing protein [Saprospiraceae bacterium]